MSHGLMEGMLLAGILMSAIPLALGVWLGVRALRYLRAARVASATPAPPHPGGAESG